MFFDERKTDRRGRPFASLRRRIRVRWARRRLEAREESAILLLLAFLTADLFTGVAHALALIGLGRTDTADPSGGLADQLLFDARDLDLGLLRHGEGDAFRRRDLHVVAEAELHGERLALHRSAIADADQLERLLVAGG